MAAAISVGRAVGRNPPDGYPPGGILPVFDAVAGAANHSPIRCLRSSSNSASSPTNSATNEDRFRNQQRPLRRDGGNAPEPSFRSQLRSG
jgi:hypothetical protein